MAKIFYNNSYYNKIILFLFLVKMTLSCKENSTKNNQIKTVLDGFHNMYNAPSYNNNNLISSRDLNNQNSNLNSKSNLSSKINKK
jgi:hypothetical protein